MGAFGLLEDNHPSHVPAERFTASHSYVSVFALWRDGLLVPGTSAILQTAHGGYRLATREAGKIWIDDQPVVIGTHPVLKQSAFICPVCQQIRYKLFNVGGRWGCYRCHSLTHASRHVHRTIPKFHRLMRLRRKIGASLVPFSPIAPKPPQCRRYWRIVVEIRRLEAGLVRHAGRDICDVLECRHDRSRCHGPGDR